MIYHSNLTGPDPAPRFPHAFSRVMGHSCGHDILSDWADKSDEDPIFGLYRNCGFWTEDEAAILYQVACKVGGRWLDIGAHTGWTACHIGAARCVVDGVDPMYRVPEFMHRAWSNIVGYGEAYQFTLYATTSEEFLRQPGQSYDGVVVDGAHDDPAPLDDAIGAHGRLNQTGVILFHDAIGGPVQLAVRWLAANGYQHRVYLTPHVLAACWRGDLTLPDHRPDPRVAATVKCYLGDLL